VKAAYIEVKSTAPVAGFTGNVLKGVAPLAVAFSNTSTGHIERSEWTFGDGSRSTQTHPTHTYTAAGVYEVALKVSGPAGENTLKRAGYVQVVTQGGGQPGRPDAPLELGEVLVDHQWKRVSFSAPFTNPIVVAKPLSFNGGHPAVVRVKGIDRTGFWIRVQEWDYLDGKHAYETVSYLVMERGRHELPDGAWVDAGRLVTSATGTFVARSFSQPLYETPVVFATVTTVNEADAVTTRLRKVTVKGFEVGMQEQESKPQKHLAESIDYVAFEPSFGVVNGLRYEVELMAGGVTDKPKTLLYQGSYVRAPRFLADMQTTNGPDTANLRWKNRNEASLELWVSEEKSKDSEIAHTTESIGYFVATKD
jgi:PKD repeat protein